MGPLFFTQSAENEFRQIQGFALRQNACAPDLRRSEYADALVVLRNSPLLTQLYDLVTQQRRIFELQHFGSRLHLFFEAADGLLPLGIG